MAERDMGWRPTHPAGFLTHVLCKATALSSLSGHGAGSWLPGVSSMPRQGLVPNLGCLSSIFMPPISWQQESRLYLVQDKACLIKPPHRYRLDRSEEGRRHLHQISTWCHAAAELFICAKGPKATSTVPQLPPALLSQLPLGLSSPGSEALAVRHRGTPGLLSLPLDVCCSSGAKVLTWIPPLQHLSRCHSDPWARRK